MQCYKDNKYGKLNEFFLQSSQNSFFSGCNVTSSPTTLTEETCVTICEEVHIGQWCLFKNKNQICVSLILSFAKINRSRDVTTQSDTNRKTKSSGIYSQKFAPVSNSNTIDALCSHFEMNAHRHWEQLDHPFYVTLENYKGTLATEPKFEDNKIRISDVLLNRIGKIGDFLFDPVLSIFFFLKLQIASQIS